MMRRHLHWPVWPGPHSAHRLWRSTPPRSNAARFVKEPAYTTSRLTPCWCRPGRATAASGWPSTETTST